MCLAAFALDCHPRYALVIAANRDEFHLRPSLAAAAWPERADVYGGRDLAGGGAWMAADRHGRIAMVTNIRRAHANGGASRGHLVRDLMLAARPVAESLAELEQHVGDYSPFNLVAGSAAELSHLSSDRPARQPLSRGNVHTLSNADLDSPWPKTLRLRAALEQWCSSGVVAFDALFRALADRQPAADAEMPDTGIGREHERFLSSPFIVGETYGTRCSTVLSVDHDGQAHLIERSFGPLGVVQQTVDLRWRIDA